jgi:hypothetical protein
VYLTFISLGISLVIVIFLIWYYKIPSAVKILKILQEECKRENIRWSIEIGSPWRNATKIELTSGKKNQPETQEPTTELLTIVISNGPSLKLEIDSHFSLETSKKKLSYRVQPIQSPADGIFTHDFEITGDNSKDVVQTIQSAILNSVITAKNFVFSKQHLGMIIAASRKSFDLNAPVAGDIIPWLPSGSSVKKGDTLFLLVINE